MLPLSRDDLLAVERPFSEARPLPRSAFVDPGALELERRAIFASSWLPVANEADLARPGDWVRAPIEGEHLVVVRTADLDLAALHAVCRHRGTLLLDGDGGHLPRLEVRCPYHGFSYDTLGRSLATPGLARPSGERARALCDLARAEVGSFAGVVFVRLAPAAEGASAPSEAGPPWLSPRRLGALRRARRVDYEVRANWKIVVGNFQESHHFPLVHPELEARTPFARSSSVIDAPSWLGGHMDLVEGLETVSESGRRLGRPFVAAPEDRARVSDALVFPLLLTSLQPDYLLTYRLAPLAVDRTLVVAEIHLSRGAPVDEAALADLSVFWDRTNDQDRAICERQQRGLASTRAAPSFYAASEDGLHAFERRVARRCLAALAEEAR